MCIHRLLHRINFALFASHATTGNTHHFGFYERFVGGRGLAEGMHGTPNYAFWCYLLLLLLLLLAAGMIKASPNTVLTL